MNRWKPDEHLVHCKSVIVVNSVSPYLCVSLTGMWLEDISHLSTTTAAPSSCCWLLSNIWAMKFNCAYERRNVNQRRKDISQAGPVLMLLTWKKYKNYAQMICNYLNKYLFMTRWLPSYQPNLLFVIFMRNTTNRMCCLVFGSASEKTYSESESNHAPSAPHAELNDWERLAN